MKFIRPANLLPVLLLVIVAPAKAQIWKKIKDQAKNAIDHAPPPPPRPGSRPAADTPAARPADASAKAPAVEAAGAPADYANYDFVAGDQIIFQPDISGEADAEVPSHFTVVAGKADIQTVASQKVVHLAQGTGSCILPLMSSVHYLP